MDFLQKPLACFSSFYIRVQSKICGRKRFFFILPFWIFPDFERNFFQTFGQKTSRVCQNYLLRVSEEQFIAWNIFLKVLNRFGFSAETFGMVLKFLCTCPEWKLRKKQFSYFSFQNFFGFWAKFFRLLAKTVQGIVKTTFFVSRRTLCAFKFFLKKFWTVLDFLQRPLAWFSKFYLRVQSKVCGRKSVFSFFLSEIFRILSENFLRILAEKRQKFNKTTFYASRGTICGLNFFLKFWIVSDFLQKPLTWFSKFYLWVQIKNCGKNTVFFVFFPELFRILSKNFSDFWPKNFKKFSKLPSTCPEE